MNVPRVLKEHTDDIVIYSYFEFSFSLVTLVTRTDFELFVMQVIHVNSLYESDMNIINEPEIIHILHGISYKLSVPHNFTHVINHHTDTGIVCYPTISFVACPNVLILFCIDFIRPVLAGQVPL